MTFSFFKNKLIKQKKKLFFENNNSNSNNIGGRLNKKSFNLFLTSTNVSTAAMRHNVFRLIIAIYEIKNKKSTRNITIHLQFTAV